MTVENAIPLAPRSRTLWLQVLGAAALGTVLTVTVILPTEYGLDPTGFGALTGLNSLSAPAEIIVETKFTAPPEIATVEAIPFRQDVVNVPIGVLGSGGLGATEYKVTLNQGQTLVYSWKSSAPVIFEFHGHTTPTDGSAAHVMDYIKGQASEGHGTLTAAISGIHGWYFANPGSSEVNMEITLAGFYVLEPGLIGIH